MKFLIPYPTSKKERSQFSRRYSLNAIYSGQFWAKRRNDSEYWHCLVRRELSRQHIPNRLFGHPVEIVFRWDDGLDCSNHAYMGKMIEDALKGHVIKDDDRRYVRRIVHEFWDGNAIQVEIREAWI